MALALQNIVVAIAALGAAGYSVRRMFGPPPPHAATGSPSCTGCQMHASVEKSRTRIAEKPAPVR